MNKTNLILLTFMISLSAFAGVGGSHGGGSNLQLNSLEIQKSNFDLIVEDEIGEIAIPLDQIESVTTEDLETLTQEELIKIKFLNSAIQSLTLKNGETFELRSLQGPGGGGGGPLN